MVVINFTKGDLLGLLKKEMSNEEIEEALFLLKCETEWEGENIECELNPDRPDMYSVEGCARAMKTFIGTEKGMPKYTMSDSGLTMRNEDVNVRPIIGCAVISDVELSDELVKSLMQLQEKLHGGLGRNRKKSAIGVHDLDRMKGKLIYREVDPEKVKFVPLGETKEMFLKEVLEQHPKGIEYKHLLENEATWPVILDDYGVVSLPPIINSERTRVSEKTQNLFVEVTGTDEKAVMHSLNIVVTNIIERTGELKSVKIDRKKYPILEPQQWSLEVSETNRVLGFDLDENKIAEALERMGHTVLKQKGGKINVSVAPYRSDIMHEIDLIEDVAIGFGYNNIEPIFPKSPSIGGISEKEDYTEKIRELMVGLGMQEYVGFILSNSEDMFDKMQLNKKDIVEIVNPVTTEYTICRTWLTPIVLKMLVTNKHRIYPQRVFEIGDVVLLDEEAEVRAKNVRKLCGAISHDKANLTEIKSIVESVLQNIGVQYEIKPINHNSFIDSRCGEILVNGESVGFFGEIHPQV
ncbi:MAG: phenylalanine--tRNA ligase subunit beta, partial [Candidatus Aenigmarchaeota archaeon]|nr:phenylalanine--tRNA ligase subunit beta [Candidatus Aenigmarchaeota archaeon]